MSKISLKILSELLREATVDQNLLDAVKVISKKHPVQFGAFHTYPEIDEIEDDVGPAT